MNRRLTVIFCILWCMLLLRFVIVQPLTAEKETRLTSVLDGLGVQSLEAKLEVSGELGRSFSERRAEQLLKEAARILGFPEPAGIEREERENGTCWTVCGEPADTAGEKSGFAAELKVFSVRDGFFADYYFQATVSGRASGELTQMRERLETLRRTAKLDGLVCLRISGSCGRLLTGEEKRTYEQTILQKLGAECVEEGREERLSLMYGYAGGLGEAVRIGTKRVNMNVIFRDSGRITRCFVGLPVVLSDD